MKVLFMGTPEFAVESLRALIGSKHSVVGVVAQPDRAVKRGKVETGAVKAFAEANGLPVFQPEKIRLCVDEIKAFGADIAVTAAYGQILTAAVLDAFPFGVINVHASLLPKYRGASPIQSAIADGESKTGVTIMRTALGLDTGDILSCVETEIKEGETAGELTERLSALGARLLVETLDRFGDITPVPQDDRLASHCRTITKSEEYLDFSSNAKIVVDKIRSLSPEPCAKTVIGGEIFKIYSAYIADCAVDGEKGEIVCEKDKMYIVCGEGAISVAMIQAPSKRAMSVADFLRGRRFSVGAKCEKRNAE